MCRRHVFFRIYIASFGTTYLLSVPPNFIAQPSAQDRLPLTTSIFEAGGRNAVSSQLAQRPRLFQFAFGASLFTLRANGPQMTPLFELPPAGQVIHLFASSKGGLFIFSIFSCRHETFNIIYFTSECSALAARHLFIFFICSTHSDPAWPSTRSKRRRPQSEQTDHR